MGPKEGRGSHGQACSPMFGRIRGVPSPGPQGKPKLCARQALPGVRGAGCRVGCELLALPASQALRLASRWQSKAALGGGSRGRTVAVCGGSGGHWEGHRGPGRQLRGCVHIHWAWEPFAECSREAPMREERGGESVNGEGTDSNFIER